MKSAWTVRHAYGAWMAEHELGFIVWTRTKEELLSCLGLREAADG